MPRELRIEYLGAVFHVQRKGVGPHIVAESA